MDPISFIHETTWRDLPELVQQQARRCLLDTLGAAIGGRGTELSRIIHQFVATVYGGQGAYLWLDGRPVSPPGAALANGMTIDSLDIHDGHPLVKGHAGAAIVPAVFATLAWPEAPPLSGQALLTSLVIGYEIALRAGIALHATACDYHTSGAWNALGCAAVTARRLGLSREQTRQALGIAEYHGPRSQMMRCVDYPTMVKDGSGWGAMAGVGAALLAQGGFTGAPAVTMEAEGVQSIWGDLGRVWQITRQYFKPHAVCRWAQPAIEGALALQQAHRLAPEQLKRITVFTFHEAVRLNCRRPQDTEAAQYSLPFPVAAALVHGRLGAAELTGAALADPQVLALAEAVQLVEEAEFNTRFPARRFARVQLETLEGAQYDSGEVEARWDATAPPSDAELRAKFQELARSRLPPGRAAELEALAWSCADLAGTAGLAALINAPVD